MGGSALHKQTGKHSYIIKETNAATTSGADNGKMATRGAAPSATTKGRIGEQTSWANPSKPIGTMWIRSRSRLWLKLFP